MISDIDIWRTAPREQRHPGLVIALISLAYLEEDGLPLSIALLAAVIVPIVALVAIWQAALGAEWIGGLWLLIARRLASGTTDMQPAGEPEHDENDQDQAQNATESGPAISAVPVVSAAAAEQQDKHDDDQNGAHFPPSLPAS